MRQGIEQRGDFLFLVVSEGARPVLDAGQHRLQARALALVKRVIEVMFADEFAIVLVPLFLQRAELLGREGSEHVHGIVDAAIDDDAVARLEAVDKPDDIIALEPASRLADRRVQKNRVFGQLLVAVPCQQALDARVEFIFLLRIEVEIIVGAPREESVGIAITDPESGAPGGQRDQQHQEQAAG